MPQYGRDERGVYGLEDCRSGHEDRASRVQYMWWRGEGGTDHRYDQDSCDAFGLDEHECDRDRAGQVQL